MLGVAACSTPPEPGPDELFTGPAIAPVRAQDRAAESFIDALVQLPNYSPPETTLVFERRALASDPFLQALESAVVARGYGVRKLTTVGGDNLVTHDAAPDASDPDVTVHTLSFGQAQMRRSFLETADGRWTPRSSLFIRGVDASGVQLGGDRVPETVPVTTRAQGAQAQLPPAGDRAVVTQPVPTVPVAPIAPTTPAKSPMETTTTAGRPPVQDVPILPVPENVAEIGESNYRVFFEGYVDQKELVLTFPDDSMVLGPANKKQIQTALTESDPTQDLYSIVGCSFGTTRIENGNEVLAIGRANRVKEELMFAGVPRNRILDEGCWAGSPDVEFPSRGVVLTVMRARS